MLKIKRKNIKDYADKLKRKPAYELHKNIPGFHLA